MWMKFTSPSQWIWNLFFFNLPSAILHWHAADSQTLGCVSLCSSLTRRKRDKIQAESKQTWRDVSHASLPSVWFLNKLKIKTIKSRSISLRTQMRSNQRSILCWHFSLQGVDLKQCGSSDFNPPLSAAACNLVLRMGGGHVLVLDIKFIRLAAREGWGRDICNQTRTSPIWWRRKGGGVKTKKHL